MKKIQDIEVKDKNVLIRIDADVAVEDGVVIDSERLDASVPTLKYLLENGAKVTIIGHIGRPDGKEIPELKMRPVEDKLIEILGTHLNWQILENLRFNVGEEKNDPEFVAHLVAGQDLFVQDAFATCHRSHASTVGVTKLLPSYVGISIQREMEGLQKILESPQEGFTIIIGGKKVEDKLPVIENLFERADNFIIGGVVANTFLKVQGISLGKSLVENSVLEKTKEILEKFNKNQNKKLLLPVDLIFSKSTKEPMEVKQESVENLKNINDFYAVDIGAGTIMNFIALIKKSKTIFLNGNMGVSEMKEFSNGTFKIVEAVANYAEKKYAGGGDTTAFIRKMGLGENFDFLSTGGGATLEFLSGKKLPGLEALK